MRRPRSRSLSAWRTAPPAATGETGKIVVRGATVMLGYWNRPEATSETIVDGWLRTGGLGRMDADGFLTLTDRSKDVIISGGANIYPREVEEALLLHQEVHEMSVVGTPDAEWGEIVVAFVVLKASSPCDSSQLDTWCRTRIAGFKRPKRYVFMKALPGVVAQSSGAAVRVEASAPLSAWA